MAKEDWRTIDRDALIQAVGETDGAMAWAQYEASKEAYRAYKAKRDAFESVMQRAFSDKLPNGYEIKFGYNFGKLSIAVGPVTERKATPKAESESLGDWLQAQAASGQRT
jgi:hypothetical protein